MHTVLLIVGGQIAHHNYPQTGQILADLLERQGYGVRVTNAAPAEIDLAGHDAAVLFTDGDFFTPDAVSRLAAYVRRGHGLVTLHTAANTNVESDELAALVGSRVQSGVIETHTAHVTDHTHPITAGLADFEIADEIHELKPIAVYHTLVDAAFKGGRQPLVYVKEVGDGRTVHLAHGHSIAGITNPGFQTLLTNAVKWVLRAEDVRA